MKIETAKLDWKADEQGNLVPISQQFGDVYYSLVDGLAESRYVFVAGNRLRERLLANTGDVFTIAELGFGTGLNFFATWQLWHDLRQEHSQLANKRLHFISFEKYPLSKQDFIQSLLPWKQQDPSIASFIKQFEAVYPTLVAGCHRLSFFDDMLTIDLWLGDALDNLERLAQSANDDDNAPTNTKQDISAHQITQKYVPKAYIDAWFLDGFAPSCNQSLWAEQIFVQMQRLSNVGTTVATFSCAGVVKRGLVDIGFSIEKIKGFGRKREMLIAEVVADVETQVSNPAFIAIPASAPTLVAKEQSASTTQQAQIVVVGAGVSGLMTAWSLAKRGKSVLILDKDKPMSGASGNPRAVLAPKMTPIHHVADHLHSIGYLYSARLYEQMDQRNILISQPSANKQQRAFDLVFEKTTAIDFMTKANISAEQIADYPPEFAQVLPVAQAQKLTGLTKHDLANMQYLPQAGLVNPQALAKLVLAESNIHFQQLSVQTLEQTEQGMQIGGAKSQTSLSAQPSPSQAKQNQQTILAEQVVICTAYHSNELDKRIFDFRKIRGQISWLKTTNTQLANLPKLPLKFGGYCARFTAKLVDEQQDDKQNDKQNALTANDCYLLMGASFVRNTTDTSIYDTEHQQNYAKLITAIPEIAAVIGDFTDVQWQGRAGVRSQTPDYHPLVGQIDTGLWALSGMGAKGYAYAPICAEILADLMTASIPPVSTELLARLHPSRKRLQQAIKQDV